MANGERCKTCDCQESDHLILGQILNQRDRSKAWVEIPDFRTTRNWTREKIHEFLVKNGMAEKDIEEHFYDVIRCAGFSTTRKRDPNWKSLAKS